MDLNGTISESDLQPLYLAEFRDLVGGCDIDRIILHCDDPKRKNELARIRTRLKLHNNYL